MFYISCVLEGSDSSNVFTWQFETGRELARFLRKLGKGQLKRQHIARILSIRED